MKVSRGGAWTMIAGLVAILLAAAGYRNATATPLVRQLALTVPDVALSPPLRIVLFSDLHVHGPDMPPERVARIADQIDALHPDLIIAAGDFAGENSIGRHYSIADAIAPLGRLRARLGVYAALGNNDYPDEGALIDALRHAGVHPLVDQVVALGPLALGGLGGRYRGRKIDVPRRLQFYRALARTPGFKVVIAHRPDEIAFAPPFDGLMLSGHTHCGQINAPLLGPLETGSDFGRKYLCGIYRRGSAILVVSAGVGTSRVPIRFGAPPDIWLIELKGALHARA